MITQHAHVRRSWVEKGFFVVRGALPQDYVEGLRRIAEDALTQYLTLDPDSGQPGDPDVNSVMHLHRPEYHREPPGSLQALLDLAAHPLILSIVEEAFGEPPVFRDTSLWFDPFFTYRAGHWHRDTQYVVAGDEEEHAKLDHPTFPLCGMQLQVPLASFQELQYVPGSNLRWDSEEEYAIRKADGCRNRYSDAMPSCESIVTSPGDLQAINPAGIHRGRYVQGRLRRTVQVTYTTAGHLADYSSAQDWFYEPQYLDPITGRTREIFERWRDLLGAYRASATGEKPFWYS